jgi:hypothetical protein
MAFLSNLDRVHAPSLVERGVAWAIFPLLFLFIGSVVVAPMWNRRADRLRRKPLPVGGSTTSSD